MGDIIAEKYRIDSLLGEGGMAVVFGAHHLLLDKPIAVKIVSPELLRPELVERFLTEARTAARIESPNVARVMDVGVFQNGLPYMVMERLDGCDLAELLSLEKRLAIGDAVDYVLQALQGIAHAHTLGIVHRDLKPANLFLNHQADGASIIKVLDFGIAKLEKGSRLTTSGQAVGSPTYMSPEHLRNSPRVDSRTDIWAMGVVLYELLTGHPPIEEEGIGETIAAILAKQAPSMRKLRPEIPEALDAAVLGCLEHNPDDRWPDVAAFARAIAPFGTGACAPIPDAIEQTLRQQLRRHSGRAMVVRSTADVDTAPVVPPRAPSVSAQEAPAVTEDSVPELRPRRRWVSTVLLLATLGAFGYVERERVGRYLHVHYLDRDKAPATGVQPDDSVALQAPSASPSTTESAGPQGAPSASASHKPKTVPPHQPGKHPRSSYLL